MPRRSSRLNNNMTIAAKKAPKKRKTCNLKSGRKCNTTTKSKSSTSKTALGTKKKRRTLFKGSVKANEEEVEDLEDLEEVEDMLDLEDHSPPVLASMVQPQWLLSLVSGFLAHNPAENPSTCLWALVSASDIRRGQRQLIRAAAVCTSWRDAFTGCRAGWHTLALRALPSYVSAKVQEVP
jgi:hypothetical protein